MLIIYVLASRKQSAARLEKIKIFDFHTKILLYEGRNFYSLTFSFRGQMRKSIYIVSAALLILLIAKSLALAIPADISDSSVIANKKKKHGTPLFFYTLKTPVSAIHLRSVFLIVSIRKTKFSLTTNMAIEKGDYGIIFGAFFSIFSIESNDQVLSRVDTTNSVNAYPPELTDSETTPQAEEPLKALRIFRRASRHGFPKRLLW